MPFLPVSAVYPAVDRRTVFVWNRYGSSVCVLFFYFPMV